MEPFWYKTYIIFIIGVLRRWSSHHIHIYINNYSSIIIISCLMEFGTENVFTPHWELI